MPLVKIDDLTIGFKGPALFEDVSTTIQTGQRIGLLGRNGAGKSTFLKLLTGEITPDNGSINIEAGRSIALLPQDVPSGLTGSAHELVLQAAKASSGKSPSGSGADADDWEAVHNTDQILSRMELEPTLQFETLSTGMKRRVLLARALVNNPDLLLLDEPTNHLDIEAINWLEDFLQRQKTAFMFITHDRRFLRKLANRILEIEGGKLFDWTCDYDTFLRRKEDAIEAEEKQNALFDKKLAEEEAWIRQGIKARRTRNEGRVRALEELRRIRQQRRSKVGSVQLQIQDEQRSGNLVLQATDIHFAHPNCEPIIEGFSTTVMRGDKVGIIGANGAGKSTLLKLLLGELNPLSGTTRQGTNLEIAYFSQNREQLDESKTVEEDVSDGYQTIEIAGNKRHVLGYLQDFLFTPDRARSQIKHLSGGERNRVLLAKLFAKPANLIVLDEPTNDLDAETLELLESRLVESKATMLIVSHDREFLNNVATSTIVFERDSALSPYAVREYVGGYDDWKRIADQRNKTQSTSRQDKHRSTTASPDSEPEKAKVENKPKKLSFKQQRELEQLPERIEGLESQIATIHTEMGEESFYKSDGSVIAKVQGQLKELETELARAYERWEELEGLGG